MVYFMISLPDADIGHMRNHYHYGSEDASSYEIRQRVISSYPYWYWYFASYPYWYWYFASSVSSCHIYTQAICLLHQYATSFDIGHIRNHSISIFIMTRHLIISILVLVFDILIFQSFSFLIHSTNHE